jgi:regulator of protease activity HflC (stomatin/prohibitin superfamily)
VARILLVGAVIYLLLGLRIVRPDEWIVVMRRGKYTGFRKHGLQWVLPFVDTTVRIELSRVSSSWKELPEEILETEVHKLVEIESQS